MNKIVSQNLTVILNVWRGDNLSFLNDSILSVINQTLIPTSLIIVSDGPINKDQILLISIFVNKYPWIKFFNTDNQQGVWAARNYALSLVNTKYVAFQDADDIMHPMKLETQLKFFMKLNVDLLSTNMIEFDLDQRILGHRNLSIGEITLGKFRNSPINNPTLMANFEVFEKVGGYKNIYLMEDYLFLLHAIKNRVKIYNIGIPLTAFRVDDKFYKRRRGIKFIPAEIMIFKARLDLGMRIWNEVWILFTRIIFRILPSNLIYLFYKFYRLRNSSRSKWTNLESWRSDNLSIL